jgi:hypothetical protein
MVGESSGRLKTVSETGLVEKGTGVRQFLLKPCNAETI